jgi:hypothetical protein
MGSECSYCKGTVREDEKNILVLDKVDKIEKTNKNDLLVKTKSKFISASTNKNNNSNNDYSTVLKVDFI